ncbi:MAG: C39 family peptidase, partial [Planctomycetes bacterium]|nr:C39 family peptidase [Planctomycetota bacterium]
MLETQPLEPVQVAPEDLSRIRDLYSRGLCLQAYQAAQPWGPLKAWSGTAGRVLAGRLAMNLGAPRLGRWLHLRAWRDNPFDPEAQYYYVRAVSERRGPLAAWKILKRWGDLPQADPDTRGAWLSFRASTAGRLRDFDTADYWLARAEEAAPESPWVQVERSYLLELEDRYPESLAAARRALELQPWYRPGVTTTAHVLQLLDRDAEALELLREADQHIESGPAMAQLALLQTELGRFAEARQSLERYHELSPLLEKGLLQWLNAQRSDAAYYCGDYARAIEWAQAAGGPFYQKIAERLAASTEGRRLLLPVGFVRQHHMTCAPATLSAISRFWSMPADHLGVAEAICYDGTPASSERHWAEQHHWVVREFTVTWESVMALLDRGVPFTLTTVGTASGHLQAAIGYDSRRETLLIRDPYERNFREFICSEMVKWLRSTGPRGMALVPQDKAALLEGLTFPDAALYDQLHRLQRALEEHDRAQAQETYAAMGAAAPEHRLTFQGRRALAAYDANTGEMLAAVEQLLQQFPDDNNLQLTKVSCLRQLARREERLALLKSLCEKPGSDPIFWQQYARELSSDAREHETALRLIRRALRYRPTDAGNLYGLANILWEQRQFDQALELYRFAASLEDKDERLARAYFIAARYLRKTGEAMEFLRSRFERFGKLSSQPARTLFWAYGQLEQTPDAFNILDRALELRPEDGELLLFGAGECGRFGNFDRASALLVAAAGQAPHTVWLRAAADLASYQGNLRAALAMWRQVVEVEPLALDAHRALTQLLAEV